MSDFYHHLAKPQKKRGKSDDEKACGGLEECVRVGRLRSRPPHDEEDKRRARKEAKDKN